MFASICFPLLDGRKEQMRIKDRKEKHFLKAVFVPRISVVRKLKKI